MICKQPSHLWSAHYRGECTASPPEEDADSAPQEAAFIQLDTPEAALQPTEQVVTKLHVIGHNLYYDSG